MAKSPNEIRFELETAMAQGHVYTLKDEVTATYHCELSADQIPTMKVRHQARVNRKKTIPDMIDELKRQIKKLQVEFELLNTICDDEGIALAFEPPKGRFEFTGRHVASIELRKEWLCDLETGAPILETCQELSKSSVVAIDEIRQGIQEPLPFPSEDDATDSDDDTADDEPHAQSEPGTAFEVQSEKPSRKRGKKADPEPEPETNLN